jgi:hypothetical protein
MAVRGGRWRFAIAHGVVVAMLATTVVLVTAVAGPAPVAQAATAFDTPEPTGTPRVEQPRDVVSVTPARLLETRSGPGLTTIDGRFEGRGRLAAGSTVELVVTGRGGVPADGVAAVILNVTAVGPLALGFITAYPCGERRPLAANLNYRPGENRPNAVLAKVGAGGKVCLYSKSATDLVVDVNGFVGEGSSTMPVSPARLLETRSGAGFDTIDGAFEGVGPVAGGTTFELTVTGRGGVPASDVSAVIMNVTAVAPRDLGFITAFPCGIERPLAANLNYAPGANRPNAVLAKVGDGGKVCFFTRSTTDLVVDLNGYVAASASIGAATPLAPARLLETRSAPGLETIDGEFQGIGSVRAGSTVELRVAGRGGVPASGVGAVMLNVAATNPQDLGFVTVFPCGMDRPLAANVNYRPGQTVPNAVLARIGEGGRVCLYSRSTVELVVDVNGWFGLAPNQPESNVSVLDDDEIVSVAFAPTDGLATDAPLVENPEQALITTRQDEGLDVGDLVVLEKPSGEPYYGRVEEREDSTTVRAEQVALADVVPVMDVSLEADTATGAVTTSEGGDAVEDVEIEPDRDAPEENRRQDVTCGAEVGVDIGVTAEADPGRFVFDVSFNKAFAGLRSARIGYAPWVEAEASVTVNGAVSCGVSTELFTKQLPTIKFVVSGVPVHITQELTVAIEGSLSASASATRTYSARADAFVGMVYEDGAWDREASMNLTVDQSSEADVAISFELAVPSITYAARAYGIVGLDIGVAAVLRLTYQPTRQKYLRLTASVDVSAALVVELDLEVITFRWAYDFVNVTVFGPLELWSKEKASTVCGVVGTPIPDEECDALVALYDDVNGSNWNDKGDWGTNTDPCTWPGVTCSGGHVRALDLTSRNLVGPVPGDIGDLTELEVLDLRNNSLTSLPSELGDLSKLTELDLTAAGLASIPSAVGDLDALTDLLLAGNALTSVPPALAGMSSLTSLDLGNNDLVGVPYTIAQLDGLEYLDLSSNEIVGLPSALWDLRTLEVLDVSENPLGELSRGVAGLRNLSVLAASGIDATSVPSEVGLLTGLTFLKLDGNRLSSLPSSYENLAALERIYLTGNRFVEVPDGLASYDTLTHVYIGQNPWDDDATSVMRAVRNRNPGIVALTLGPIGCPAIGDASVIAWVETFDVTWDNGC